MSSITAQAKNHTASEHDPEQLRRLSEGPQCTIWAVPDSFGKEALQQKLYANVEARPL